MFLTHTHTGEFGVVYRGTLTAAKKSIPKKEVAVKTLKGAVFFIATSRIIIIVIVWICFRLF